MTCVRFSRLFAPFSVPLFAWSLHEWPTVGLVGPTMNGAPEPQGLREGPVSLDDVNTFAARRRRAYADAGLFVPRLTGSCLLARREVLERIGGLDERFATGLFADDDWCFRAREAGWRSLLARDLYLHRCAGGAFRALGAATREQDRKSTRLNSVTSLSRMPS